MLIGEFDHWSVTVARRYRGKQPARDSKSLKSATKPGGKKARVHANSGAKNGKDAEPVFGQSTKVRKIAKVLFPNAKILGDTERAEYQLELKGFVGRIIAHSTSMPSTATCYQAISELANVGGLDFDAVEVVTRPYLVDAGRLHMKKVGNIFVSHQRGQDLLMLYAPNLESVRMRQVVMVSNRTHGAEDMDLCIRMLFVCHVAGFDANELSSLKMGMQEALSS